MQSASDGLVALDKVDMFALGATLYELASGIPLPASGERWSALRGGKAAMLLPAVTHQLQSLMKVRNAMSYEGWPPGVLHCDHSYVLCRVALNGERYPPFTVHRSPFTR
eukprot:355301-Chlamydomonas_euryale.AAC.1